VAWSSRTRAVLMVFLCAPTTVATGVNEVTGDCIDKYKPDWNKAAACQSDYVSEEAKRDREEFREFLRENPRYRFPGQSWNKCFGKPREFAFESLEQVGDKVIVVYKKFLAPCEGE